VREVAHGTADRFIAPTVLVNVPPDSPVMQEEIFGPILPILEVGSVKEVVDFVTARPSPLGLYLFAEDKSVTEQILAATTSGDAAVNDCAFSQSFRICPSAALAILGWRSITATMDPARTRTHAVFCITAR
jgi:acyl-CoA reductase-like NAD-dependent aldehyde dehydrogenase